MSFLGSTFGRALAGVGEAGANIAQKYIDDEILRNRAQAMADIQRNSAVQQAQQIDQYQNSAERRDAMRTEATKDQEATEAAKLRGDISRAKSKDLTQAQIDNENAIIEGTAGTKLDAERMRRLVIDPLDVKKANATRDPSLTELHQAQAKLANIQLQAQQAVVDAHNELLSAIQSGDSKAQGAAQEKLDALQGKGGKLERFYNAVDGASKAMTPMYKILSDPTADAEAKEEARQGIRRQEALIDKLGEKIGINFKEASKPPVPQGAIELLRKDPSTRDQFDAKYGPGRAAEFLGADQGAPDRSAPPAAAPAPRAAPASTLPSTTTGDSVLNNMGAENEQKLAGVEQQYRAAKDELKAAIASGGNPQAQIAAAQKLQALRNDYTKLANNLFGNNAQRYVDKLNSI